MNCVKLNWFKHYVNYCGKWKNMFNYWIGRASGQDKLGWYILNRNSHSYLHTTPFYRDLINIFKMAEGKIDSIFSSVLETGNLPLWNNNTITQDNNTINSPVLKSNGIILLKQIVNNYALVSYINIARRCKILKINAGRIMYRIRNCININLVKENRIGPPDHPSNKVTLWNNNEDSSEAISHTTVKSNYRNFIIKRAAIPIAQEKWENVLNRNNLNWNQIWKNTYCNDLIDPEEKHLLYNIKHRIIPTKHLLLKMRITSDEICPLCQTESESVEHLFSYCIKSQEA